MTFSHLLHRPTFIIASIGASILSLNAQENPLIGSQEDHALELLYQSLIPKQEIGALEFLERNPTFDGRDTVIAIFDTGVDPGAPNMQVTTTGERKIVDVIDASGAGDVDMSEQLELSDDGTLKGLTGRTLVLPGDVENPSGIFRIGFKQGIQLFHRGAWTRVMNHRKELLESELTLQKAADMLDEKWGLNGDMDDKAVLEAEKFEELKEAHTEKLLGDDVGPVYDCVLWNDGEHWNVIVDTDEDGDLAEETILRPFGIDGEYAQFPDFVAMNFAVQVYDEGNLLSIVTTSGSHGTHVAGIAAGYDPENPRFTGVAPGARILSVRMGDVRIGGSSVYTGENRAVASAAQYKVDVMNASWGGQSTFQDASAWGIKLYNMLAEKYGITSFVSAGNDGPAFSTLGSPGGEARSVIGVGAYLSPEMGKWLYNVVDESPDTMFMFSARGPLRNGDLGVDIVAPGAATAPLALDSLSGADRYNGTSMAAPSAAGVGALLISAAKQTGVKYSPARIQYALMNSATRLEQELPHAQGAGLIQVDQAWEHLQQFQSVKELDVTYEANVSGNRYSDGPGLYLRGGLPSDLKSFRLAIQPIFPESVSNQEQYAFDTHFKLSASHDWIRIPEFIHLSNAQNSILPEIDFSQFEVGNDGMAQFGTIDFHLADHPDAGPLLSVPLTLIDGNEIISEDGYLPEVTFNLDASTTYRRFIKVPADAHHLSLTLSYAQEDSIQKLFVVDAMTLVANRNIDTYNTKQYLRLSPGEKIDVEIPTIPGEIMELSIHQAWAYDDATDLAYEGKWEGLHLAESMQPMFGLNAHARADVVPMRDGSLDVYASLDYGVIHIEPAEERIFPGDQRGYFPPADMSEASIQSFWIEHTYHFKSTSKQTVWFKANEYATEYFAGGGIIEIYDEDGLLIGNSYPSSFDDINTIDIPKGDIKLVRQYIAHKEEELERLKSLPLLLCTTIKPVELKVFQDEKNFSSASSTSTIQAFEGRRTALFIASPGENPVEDLDPMPSSLLGSLSVNDGEISMLHEPISMVLAGAVNGSSETGKTKPAAMSLEDFQKTQYATELKFLQSTRGATDSEVVKERKRIIRDLKRQNKTDPELWIELLYDEGYSGRILHPWLVGLDGPSPRQSSTSTLERFLKNIEQTIEDCKPEEVAAFFGAKPVAGETDKETQESIESKTKVMEAVRSWIAKSHLIAASTYLIAGQPDLANEQLLQASRWNVDEASQLEFSKLKALYHIESKEPAHALGIIQTALKDAPEDPQLLDWQSMIHDQLEWNVLKKREALRDSIRAATSGDN
jgi:tripeptidyl-peptidase-2